MFQVNFTATGFIPLSPPPDPQTVPQNPVSGSFVFEAASATSPITALDSVNLTIAGHAYALADVSFHSPSGTATVIGGSTGGPNSIVSGANDFYIEWTTAKSIPFDFEYSTAANNQVFESVEFPTFAITPVAGTVPEPASAWLLLTTGPLLLLGLRRLRKTAGTE
jgi:hypothetical protein